MAILFCFGFNPENSISSQEVQNTSNTVIVFLSNVWPLELIVLFCGAKVMPCVNFILLAHLKKKLFWAWVKLFAKK